MGAVAEDTAVIEKFPFRFSVLSKTKHFVWSLVTEFAVRSSAMLLGGAMGRSYRDLIAWQKAMKFVTEIYQVTQRFPPEERYGITNQLRRASVSVPSNIAEGQARFSQKEFHHFLSQHAALWSKLKLSFSSQET